MKQRFFNMKDSEPTRSENDCEIMLHGLTSDTEKKKRRICTFLGVIFILLSLMIWSS